MTEIERLIDQFNRSREALIRARDRTTIPASREFLEQILAKIDAKTAELRANAASPVRSPAAAVRERPGRSAVVDICRTLLSSLSNRIRTFARRRSDLAD